MTKQEFVDQVASESGLSKADAGKAVDAVLGVVEGGAAAGRIVAVRQGGLLATSFHPELAGDARLHALFAEIVKEQVL